MDCRQCKEDITAYLDGELNSAGSAEMRSHLETCPSCTEELRSFQKASAFFESHTRELELRPGSWNPVQARISTASSPSPFGFLVFNRWRYALATLAFAAALSLGYFWHHQAERKSLEEYIAQYVKAREAGQLFPFRFGGAKSGLGSPSFKTENPFIEAKATIDVNPFRSEDR